MNFPAGRSLGIAGLWLSCQFAVQPATAVQTRTVAETLTAYDMGRYTELFELLRRASDLHRFYPTFQRDADAWVSAAEPALRWRRTLVAASVAVEIAHLLRREPANRAAQYLVWASLLVRRHPPARGEEVERLWYLASMAGMLELDEPWALVTGQETSTLALKQLVSTLGAGGHLAAASVRFPEEPRFKLAEVAALEWPLTQIALDPGYLELVRSASAGGNDTRRRGRGYGPATQASVEQAHLIRIPDLKRRYEALSEEVSLRGEIALHLGFLDGAAMDAQAAVSSLREVLAVSEEPYLGYLGHYFMGCVLARTGDYASAAEAFERANTIVPNARSAATSLAAIMLLSNSITDRERGYSLLQTAYSDHAPEDPWRLYGRGDARLWTTYTEALREALK